MEVKCKFSHSVLDVLWEGGKGLAVIHPKDSPPNHFKEASIRGEKVTGCVADYFYAMTHCIKTKTRELTNNFIHFMANSLIYPPQKMSPSRQHIGTSGPSMTSEKKALIIRIKELNSTMENKHKFPHGASSSSWHWVLQGTCALTFWSIEAQCRSKSSGWR